MEEHDAPLAQFSEPVRTWFLDQFRQPTDVQSAAWQSIAGGDNTLVVAPTGSGKTLSAFLWAIDRLCVESTDAATHASGTTVLYISPLKALGVDIEKNLRQPLLGIREQYESEGLNPPSITVGVRSGDTTPGERRRLLTKPPDILITTPESLYLMLTSKAAETLARVKTVIIDEIHALASDKRGAHLALSLERLDDLLPQPAQRVGLSATVKPLDEVARFLGGVAPVRVVAPPATKELITEVLVPFADMTNPQPENLALGMGADNPRDEHRWGSVWPAIEQAVYERICAASSTIVFANSRRMVERLTAALNRIHAQSTEVEDAELARAHHGSVSKEQRLQVEDDLKSGALRCVVATASLELGIDMGEVEQIVHIDAPPSVASGLQRIGRSGHQVGNASKAFFFPTHRSKLLELTTVCERIQERDIERLKVLRNPLDLLAQQTVAEASRRTLDVDEWYDTVCRAAPFRNLPRESYEAVLDLLSGKYPSTDFAELRPRIVWNREEHTLTGRPAAGRLAIMGGGTIPDRGLYRVEAAAAEGDTTPAARIGELDEEMVHESRVGEIFILGTTTWRIREITPDRVKVVPAPGRVGKMPFWRGESMHRPSELGQAIGELTAHLDCAARQGGEALDRVREQLRQDGLDENAVSNLFSYLAAQREATGIVPGARQLVVERTKDEMGDWRIILESPLGMPVHAPWALAVLARLRRTMGQDGQAQASNDGIVVTVPDTGTEPTGAELFVFDPGDIERIVTEEVSGSALFAARFRECAARALVLGGGKPGKRAPLWQQRQRATRLLEVAAKYPDFPIMLETARECLQDVYDMDSLRAIHKDIAVGRIELREVTTEIPSPFARSLLFGYVGEYLYQGDMPLGERRLAALNLDSTLLSQLLGHTPQAEALDPQAIADVEAQLQRTADGYELAGKEGLTDLLRELGHLDVDQLGARLRAEQAAVAQWCGELEREGRIASHQIGDTTYYSSVEDTGTLATALGWEFPQKLIDEFPARQDPLADLLSRYFRTHGSRTMQQIASHFAVAATLLEPHVHSLAQDDGLRRGNFSMVVGEPEWVSAQVLQRITRRAASVLRAAIQPVEQSDYQRFLLDWQYCGGQLRDSEGTLCAIEQLVGVPLVASTIETLVLPQRIADYRPELLDDLVASGEVVWAGEGSVGDAEGKLSWHLRDSLGSTIRPANQDPRDGLQTRIVELLQQRGALFGEELRKLVTAERQELGLEDVVQALWSLAWAGHVTSDSLIALRATIAGSNGAQKTKRRAPRGRTLRRGSFSSLRPPRPTVGNAARLAGRWSLIDREAVSEVERLSTDVSLLLDRHGIVTRGAAVAEGFPGGFAAAYQVLAEFEQAGYCRRGHFIAGLGGAQFAAPSTVDRLREVETEEPEVITLSGADPALAYGAALPWPDARVADGATPRRNPGSLVVLHAGEPVFYLERGGKTALSFAAADPQILQGVADSLVATCTRAMLESFTLETIDGEPAVRSQWFTHLARAGMSIVPRGLSYSRPVR